MLASPQDIANYGGIVPASQVVPMATAIPSQTSKRRLYYPIFKFLRYVVVFNKLLNIRSQQRLKF